MMPLVERIELSKISVLALIHRISKPFLFQTQSILQAHDIGCAGQ